MMSIRRNYEDVFGVDDETAREMARLTCGYSFAFQVLGYLLWKNGKENLKRGGTDALKDVLPQFDQYMEEYVYEKIWSELSETDRRILKEMANRNLTSAVDIQEVMKITPQFFYNYKKRLDQKGIVDTSERGRLSIQLPRFDCFIKERSGW